MIHSALLLLAYSAFSHANRRSFGQPAVFAAVCILRSSSAVLLLLLFVNLCQRTANSAALNAWNNVAHMQNDAFY